MVETIFSSKTSEFIINRRSDDGDKIIIASVSVRFPFKACFDDGKDFVIPSKDTHYYYLSHRPGCKEIDTCILRFHDSNRRTDAKDRGWFIPFNALFTEDEGFENNQFFREYSFYAYSFLLSLHEIQEYLLNNETIAFSEILDKLSSNSLYDLSTEIKIDPTHSDTSWFNSIIIIDISEDMPKIELPHIQPALIEKGFVFGKSDFQNPIAKAIKDGEIKKWATNFTTLQACSQHIYSSDRKENNGFSHNYFSQFWEHVFIEKNPYIRFFDLYQIIEILMDEVLVNILESMITSIKQENGGLRDYDALLKNYIAEKKRISIVFECGRITCIGDEHIENKDFLDICNEFLKSNKHKESKDLSSALYSVRNMIVHRFRIIISEDNRKKLNNLNEHFILFLTRLFRSYSLDPIEKLTSEES